MITAAAADGEITEDEKQTIANEAGNNPELAQWLAQEIQNPISINEIARLVGNDTALASNVYLAARLVSKDLSRKEIIFLADLAQALGFRRYACRTIRKTSRFVILRTENIVFSRPYFFIKNTIILVIVFFSSVFSRKPNQR